MRNFRLDMLIGTSGFNLIFPGEPKRKIPSNHLKKGSGHCPRTACYCSKNLASISPLIDIHKAKKLMQSFRDLSKRGRLIGKEIHI